MRQYHTLEEQEKRTPPKIRSTCQPLLWERLSCCCGSRAGTQAVAPLNSGLMPRKKGSGRAISAAQSPRAYFFWKSDLDRSRGAKVLKRDHARRAIACSNLGE